MLSEKRSRALLGVLYIPVDHKQRKGIRVNCRVFCGVDNQSISSAEFAAEIEHRGGCMIERIINQLPTGGQRKTSQILYTVARHESRRSWPVLAGLVSGSSDYVV